RGRRGNFRDPGDEHRIASQVSRCRSSRAGMSAMHTPDSPDPQPARRFASTRWSLVAAAGQGASPEAQEALAVLCRVYWYPLYAYARRRLANVEDAQDATQAFFAQLLEKDYLQAADPERGKFRSFLLTAFKRFLARE